MKTKFCASLACLGLFGAAMGAGACSSASDTDTPADGGVGGGSTSSSGSATDGGSRGSVDGGGGSSGNGRAASNCEPAKVSYGVESTVALKTATDSFTENFLAADFNNDGAADLVGTDRIAVDVALNQGNGTFAAAIAVPAQPGTNGAMATADFDGDGNMDVLVGASDSVDCLLGKGDGSFKIPINTPILGSALFDLLIHDFNGDGKPDVYFRGTTGDPGILLNAGAGTFAGPGTVLRLAGVGGDTALGFGDVDGNGAADLGYYDANQNSLCIGANSGSGNFATPVCYPATPNLGATFVRMADVDGNGALDVVLFSEDGDSGGSAINVWTNKGDGTFNDRVAYSHPPISSAFEVVDVNNDKKPDLVIGKSYGAGGEVTLILNAGDGTFLPATAATFAVGGASGTSKSPMAVADFAGNGLVGFARLKDLDGNVNVVTTTCKP